MRPHGSDLTVWYDITPIRPDEFARQRAMRWTQAACDQRVYQEALADVAQEAQGFHTLATSPAGQAG